MQVFKVSNSYDKNKYKIEPFEAVSIGEKSMYYMYKGKQKRAAKIATYDSYFETEEQAKQHIVDLFAEEKRQAKRESEWAISKLSEATIALQKAVGKYKLQPSGKLKITF